MPTSRTQHRGSQIPSGNDLLLLIQNLQGATSPALATDISVLQSQVAVLQSEITIGQQVKFNQVTANYTNSTATGGTLALASHTSGTAPTITLPSDGYTYRVEFLAWSWASSVASDQGYIAIGTAPSTTYAAASAILTTSENALPPLVIPQIVASGQVLNIYTCSATTGRVISVFAGSSPLSCASSLAAYRVA